MKIIINGETREIAAQNLALLLEECAISNKVATAVNEDFVPASLRVEKLLNDGDRVEILSPMQGG